MSRYGKIFKYIKIDDVKRKHRDSIIAEKIRIKKIEKFVSEVVVEVEKAKSDWRKELSEAQLKESDWTITTSPNQMGNSVGATFQHTPSGNTIRVSSGLGGVDAHSTAPVTIDWGFGETEQVAPPTYNQLPLAGLPMPVSAADPMARRNNAKKAKDINKQLDASEKVAEKARADALMKARLEVLPETKGTDIIATPETIKKYEQEKKKYDEALEKYEKELEKVREANYVKRDARNVRVESLLKKYKIDTNNSMGGTGGYSYQLVTNPKKGSNEPNKVLVMISNDNSFSWRYSDKVNIRVYYPEPGKEINIKKIAPTEVSHASPGKYSDGVVRKGISTTSIENLGGMAEDIDIHDFPDKEPTFDMKRPLKPATVNLADTPLSISKSRGRGDTAKYINNMLSTLHPKFQAPAKIFYGYITGTLPEKINNDFFGERAVADAFNNMKVFPYSNSMFSTGGIYNMQDRGMWAVIGGEPYSNLKMEFDPQTMKATIKMKFGYNFVKNSVEWDKQKPTGVGGWISKKFTQLVDKVVFGGEYGADSKLPGAGYLIQQAKERGLANPTKGNEISIDVHDLKYNEDSDGMYQWAQNEYWKKMAEFEMMPPPSQQGTPSTPPSSPPPIGIPPTPVTPKTSATPSTPEKVEKKKEGRLDAYGGVDKLYDKKKKKVTESRVFDKIKKDFSYKGQPSPDGFPDTPPPKLKNGWHPEYGNKDSSYNRLDPISAKSMPKTGNKKIDAKVEKAKKKTK